MDRTIPHARLDPSRGVILAGAVTAAIYLYVALWMPIGNSWAHVTRFLVAFGAAGAVAAVVWVVLTRSGESRRAMRWVLGFAVLFRVLLLPAGFAAPDPLTAMGRDLGGERPGFGKFLLYDNDVWRFVWDGHVMASGYSPYSFSPLEVEETESLSSDLLSDELWWDVYDNVSFQSLVTVYPPGAELYFLGANRLAPGSVLVLKLGVVAADIGICLLLLSVLRRLRLSPAGLVLYAWNPLVLKETAGSAHYEPLMLLPLLLAVDWATRGRGARAAMAGGVAALVKVAPVALVPVFARRLRPFHWLAGVAVLVAGCLPFSGTFHGWLETAEIYSRGWHFNSGVWAVLKWVLETLGVEASAAGAAWIGRIAVLVVMLAVWRRDDGSALAAYRGSFFILAALTLLSSTVMPWYLLWALPFAVVAGYPAWAFFCVLSLLSYGFYAGEVEQIWWRVVEYGGLVAAWVWQTRLSPRATATE